MNAKYTYIISLNCLEENWHLDLHLESMNFHFTHKKGVKGKRLKIVAFALKGAGKEDFRTITTKSSKRLFVLNILESSLNNVCWSDVIGLITPPEEHVVPNYVPL